MSYTHLIPKPKAESVNTGLSPLHQHTVLELIGAPCKHPPVDGGGIEVVTNERLRKQLVTDSVGPFRVTGHKLFLAALRRGLNRLGQDHADLWNMLGTAGGLNVRFVRGSRTNWSNHAFGFAVDITIGGQLDDRGDDKVQSGLLIVYSYLKSEKLFWGTEFGTEDSMHFEASDELVRQWAHDGVLI